MYRSRLGCLVSKQTQIEKYDCFLQIDHFEFLVNLVVKNVRKKEERIVL